MLACFMKASHWLSVLGLAILVQGCGSESTTARPEEQTSLPSNMKKVVGSARFGNQCPYGSVIPPQPVAIELYDCPLNVPQVELTKPLQSFILQVDCKKKTLDIRSDDRSVTPTSWEVMPDGNFYLTMNAGRAYLAEDGAGNKNCSTPLMADLWGKIDCQDRDQAKIKVQTVWWLDKTLQNPSLSPLPSPSPSFSVSGSPGSSVPRVVPSTRVSMSPSSSPSPGGSFVPATRPNSHPLSEPSTLDSSCQIPKGCYFHTIVEIGQCS